jgi:tetratricopeptide (TPR) repeat protein
VADITDNNVSSSSDDGLLLDQASLDALLEAALNEEPAEQPIHAPASPLPIQPDEPDRAISLSQADIDGLLGEDHLDAPLVQQDLDSVLGGVSQSESSTFQEESDSEPILSQDMIDALVSAAAAPDAAPTSTPKPPPPPPPPKHQAEDLLSQDDLDALLAQAQAEAQEKRSARQRAMEKALETHSEPPPPPAPEPKPEPKPAKVRRERKPWPLTRYLAGNILKALSSLTVGILASFGTYSYLHSNPMRDAGFPVATLTPQAPEPQKLTETGEKEEHPEQPEKKTEELSPAEQEKEDRIKYGQEYQEIASTFKTILKKPRASDIRLLKNRIDDFINITPSHPKAVDVLQFKARLCMMEQNPYATRETYRKILSSYGDSPRLDSALLGAAESANAINLHEEAIQYAERLLADYPDSPVAEDAHVVMADSYSETDRVEDAKSIYEKVLQNTPDSRAGAASQLGLARLAFDRGQYQEAIDLLEKRKASPFQSENADKAAFILAKGYHRAGRLPEARETLNTLLKDFPKSHDLPSAYIELSRVLEEMGQRPEALQVARQSSEQFPKDAQVLRSEGALLALDGKHKEAGDLLLSAVHAGLDDPQVLVEAARNFSAGEAYPEAKDTYERVLSRFPKSPLVFVSRMELAETIYRSGKQEEGIRRLEQLLKAAESQQQKLPLVIALAKMYEDLGLHERASELSKEIAAVSTEPEVLAKAAEAMMDGGSRDEGAALADRIDISKLSEDMAYTLLTKHADCLAESDPAKSAGLLEKAYGNYPTLRAQGLSSKLIRAYLAANDPNRAEQLIASLEEESQLDPIRLSELRATAVAVGDYHFDKKEFASAAKIYEKALIGDDGKSPECAWAKYQRANIFHQSGDYESSAKLYDEVAKLACPWSREASVKAEYVRTEQRIHDKPIEPPSASQTNTEQTPANPV